MKTGKLETCAYVNKTIVITTVLSSTPQNIVFNNLVVYQLWGVRCFSYCFEFSADSTPLLSALLSHRPCTSWLTHRRTSPVEGLLKTPGLSHTLRVS